MPRYAAFLRGVSPMNLRMPDLKEALERAGFTQVKTLLSSGNVVFDARAAATASIERKVEAAMSERLGRTFMTIVRPLDALAELIESDPYVGFDLPTGAKRVVTFLLRSGAGDVPKVRLPMEFEGARILTLKGSEVFSAYVPGPKGPVFMSFIEKTFGKDVTTRTWDTVRKVSVA